MKSGDQVTRIRGVERHPLVGADKEIKRRQVGLMVEGEPDDYLPGTHWVISPQIVERKRREPK